MTKETRFFDSRQSYLAHVLGDNYSMQIDMDQNPARAIHTWSWS